MARTPFQEIRMTSHHEKMQVCKPFLWVSLALALFASGCGQQAPPDTRAADEATIKDLDAQWSKTAGARDVDGTISYYADDASMLPPNAPIANGKAAIRADWAAFLVPGSAVSWEANKVEVARSGDLAYTLGDYQSTMKDAQGKLVMDRGKYVEAWKKQADGKWKVVADIFNSDLPVTPAAPEKKAHAKPHSHHGAHAAHHKKHA
jgi:uncharacterized protein (TIGR02246 family)